MINIISSTPLDAIAAAAILLCLLVVSRVHESRKKISFWRKICEDVRKQRNRVEQSVLVHTGHEEDGIFHHDTHIAKMTCTQLLAARRAGSISTQRIVAAFARRSRKIGRSIIRCVTEEFYDEGMAKAAEFDNIDVDTNEEQNRILMGVPVSIKDTMFMKGALCTCGMACKAAEGPAEEDGLLVKIMRSHGAIPFVRGNVPQCLMLPESNNNIFGASCNPWDLSRTPGGSSGGGGGIVAARCSPLSIGSDVGGSIRIPAHFNGICGLKPTPERITKKGMASLTKEGKRGQQIIQVTAGPLANSVDDLTLAMSALCGPVMWNGDVTLPRLPWQSDVVEQGLGRPLKIGYFDTDHWFEPCAAIKRAVHDVVAKMGQAGHKMIAFDPPETGWQIARLYYGQMGAEGNMKGFVDALQGEPMLPQYAVLKTVASIPNFIRPILAWSLELTGNYRQASIVRVTRNQGLSTRQYWKLVADTFALRSQWEKSIQELELDAVVFPPAAVPAFPHGSAKDLTPAFTYMMLANLLHWPAGVVPVTQVLPGEEVYEVEKLSRNQQDMIARCAAKACQGSAGLPVGIQVMTSPFKEELALHVMKEVERVVGFKAVPKAANF